MTLVLLTSTRSFGGFLPLREMIYEPVESNAITAANRFPRDEGNRNKPERIQGEYLRRNPIGYDTDSLVLRLPPVVLPLV